MRNFNRRVDPLATSALRPDSPASGSVFSSQRPSLAVCCGLLFLSLTVGLAVLRSGGVNLRDWSICLLAIGAVSVVYWSIYPPGRLRTARAWSYTVLALPAYVVFQLLPLPAALVNLTSPGHKAISNALSSIGVSSSFIPISIEPSATVAFLLRAIGYLLVFLLIRELSSQASKTNAWLAAAPLAAIGAIEALWGIAQQFQGVDVQGSYANKNHFAGLLEMAIPFSFARILYLCERDRHEDRSRCGRFLELVLCSAVTLLLFVALLDSESKMGLISGVAALFVIGLLWTISRLKNWRRWIGLACIASLCLFGLVFLPSDDLVVRFGRVMTSSQNAGEGRWPIWIDTLRLVSAFPLFGCGLGTYQTAFLKYQTSVIDNTFAFAHNDYLQLLAELGLVGWLILAGCVLPIVGRCFQAAVRYSRSPISHLALGCTGAITAIGLHSFADFNLYIPANAAVLAWILGISASLTIGPHFVRRPRQSSAPMLRPVLINMGCLLMIYGSAEIVFLSKYRDNARAEKAFCRFGICDSDAVVASETRAHQDRLSKVPARELESLLLRDPASPSRWADLGESAGDSDPRSKSILQNAVQFGPFLPPVLLRVGTFYASHNQAAEAVSLTARVLFKTDTYDGPIFDRYNSQNVPLQVVLSRALAGNRRASQAYFRYVMSAGNLSDASIMWKWLLVSSYTSEPIAREYVDLLASQRDYEGAARVWAAFLGPRGDGYLVSNWIYNGDLETEPSGAMFDWEIQQRDTVTVSQDANVFHSGRYSLRLEFAGKQNLDYQQIRQIAFVLPGAYRFEAFVRTDALTTDEGIGFRIFDPEKPSRLSILTEQVKGTHDWTRVARDFIVSGPTETLEIRVSRKPSLRFDSNVQGTAWIDSVRLSRVT